MALETTLPTFLKTLMVSNNLTQAQLGALCGRNHTTISKLMTNRSMNTKTFESLMEAMGEKVALVLSDWDHGFATIKEATGIENMHMKTLEKLMHDKGETITLILKSGNMYTLKIAEV